MIRIIGFTDTETVCECCGKKNLKGTYCLEIDGVELYYGSVCAFKNHGITEEEQNQARSHFAQQKNIMTALDQLNAMHAEATGNDYLQKKVLAFIKKKGLDLQQFLFNNVEIYEETKFYTAYAYGAQVLMIDKNQ